MRINTMNINELSKQLKMETEDLLVMVTRLNLKHKLGIDDFSEMTRPQYDVIRSLLDADYLVKLIMVSKTDRKYNYQKTQGYVDLQQWISENNLNEFSTKDVKQSLPEPAANCGMQNIAAAMRAAGYESRVIYLDNGKQGRRWFNDALWSKPEVSFI